MDDMENRSGKDTIKLVLDPDAEEKAEPKKPAAPETTVSAENMAAPKKPAEPEVKAPADKKPEMPKAEGLAAGADKAPVPEEKPEPVKHHDTASAMSIGARPAAPAAGTTPVKPATGSAGTYGTSGTTGNGAYGSAAGTATGTGTYGTSTGTSAGTGAYGTPAGTSATGTYGTAAGTSAGTGTYGTTTSTPSASGTIDAQNTTWRDDYNAGASRARQKKYMSITKPAFIIILIAAMLISMVLSTLASMIYTNSINGGGTSNATDYKLTASDETLSYKSIIKKAQDSVVSITTESVTNDIWAQNYVTQGAGSGVIITKNGYIITCEHVIDGARKITVTLNNKKQYDADIVGADASNDIAVIKINATGLSAATYGDSSKLEVGDQVVAIGNPLGSLSGTATTGIISALNRNLQIDNRTLNLFQTDASINPGNSGGGMFDASGNLIGIVEAKSTGSDIDGLGFATPINKAAEIAKTIIDKGGDIDSGKEKNKNVLGKGVIIGIMIGEIDDTSAKEFGYTHGGLLIRSVTSDEAKKAGLEVGDIIYKADGKKVATQDDLSSVLAKKEAGDKLRLSVARQDGRDQELTTTLISSRNDY